MTYRRKWFWTCLTISLTVLSLIVSGLFAGGVAAAVPIAGIGGFSIEADRIVITDFKLLPKVGPTSEKKAVPQVATQMDAKIRGLRLYKDLHMPGQGKVRILVTASGEVISKGMVLDMSKLTGDHDFKKLTIKEKTSNDFRQKFGMDAPDLVLTNPKMRGHYLFNNSISLPGMKLELKKLD
ncbi:DUF6230 family protein [Salinithrix halophila]|uniref:DUF6230 family protein n=1 Tax=Salinithrix halophila TaxID=1485204 RepID=UPI0036D30B96